MYIMDSDDGRQDIEWMTPYRRPVTSYSFHPWSSSESSSNYHNFDDFNVTMEWKEEEVRLPGMSLDHFPTLWRLDLHTQSAWCRLPNDEAWMENCFVLHGSTISLSKFANTHDDNWTSDIFNCTNPSLPLLNTWVTTNIQEAFCNMLHAERACQTGLMAQALATKGNHPYECNISLEFLILHAKMCRAQAETDLYAMAIEHAREFDFSDNTIDKQLWNHVKQCSQNLVWNHIREKANVRVCSVDVSPAVFTMICHSIGKTCKEGSDYCSDTCAYKSDCSGKVCDDDSLLDIQGLVHRGSGEQLQLGSYLHKMQVHEFNVLIGDRAPGT
ncbi:hypothetical protein DFH29DRAFT_1021346 [Suillus ampliporus]|nr:hypothetical protein DFH29DRAFT_1021346 [Suillus ampliporus]